MRAASPDLVIQTAWRQNDPTLQADAKTFWERLNLLPHGASAEKRLQELCAVAYMGDAVAGVSTATIQHLRSLRLKLAMFRCAVSPDARSHHVATETALLSCGVLEQWSAAHPEDAVMGVGIVVQSRLLVESDRHAVWPNTKFSFVGYTPNGFQMRVYWFAHATVSDYFPEPGTRAAAGRPA